MSFAGRDLTEEMQPRDNKKKDGDGETRLIKGEKDVEALAYAFIERAGSSGYLVALADSRIPKETEPATAFIRQMFVKNPRLKFQLIVDLRRENLP